MIWGMGLSHEITQVAEAEPVHYGEGNTNGTEKRGTNVLPGSKAISRIKGKRRNLRSLVTTLGLVTGGALRQGITGAAGCKARWRIEV